MISPLLPSPFSFTLPSRHVMIWFSMQVIVRLLVNKDEKALVTSTNCLTKVDMFTYFEPHSVILTESINCKNAMLTSNTCIIYFSIDFVEHIRKEGTSFCSYKFVKHLF